MAAISYPFSYQLPIHHPYSLSLAETMRPKPQTAGAELYTAVRELQEGWDLSFAFNDPPHSFLGENANGSVLESLL